MDQREHDELLYRLDERLERIESEHIRRLDIIEKDVAKHDQAIENLDSRVQRSETLLNAITFGLGSLITGVAAKFTGALAVLKGIF